ncbi:MAG: flavodoxin family protein [Clostridiaceae bacterium]|nr:flavodoxin family protein [Clostridiaceae bacterium]
MKNIIVIVGSPRKNGNTELLADAFIEGARSAGNPVEKLSIIGKKIGGCLGCNACCRNMQHQCVQHDDMEIIYKDLNSADVIVIATPIYFYGVSSQLKCLIDRLHNPIRNTFCVKKLGLLAVCADKQESVFDSVIIMYRSVLNYFSLADGGMVLVNSVSEKGDIKGNPKLKAAEDMGKMI